jgi:hypothetical protein
MLIPATSTPTQSLNEQNLHNSSHPLRARRITKDVAPPIPSTDNQCTVSKHRAAQASKVCTDRNAGANM